jgi:hypothetical protein
MLIAKWISGEVAIIIVGIARKFTIFPPKWPKGPVFFNYAYILTLRMAKRCYDALNTECWPISWNCI